MNRLATLLFIGLPVIGSYGQIKDPTNKLPKVILPTAHSQLFQAQIDYPVCEYNGLPEITIPLYEIKTKGFTIPVILSYRASGIKYNYLYGYVADGSHPEYTYHDGELGAGWTLSIGGYRMMRTINGKADEMRPKASPSYLKTLTDAEETDKYLSRIYHDRGFLSPFYQTDYLDGEYDFFFYNLPTSNGRFILDENYSPIKIGTSLDRISLDVTQATEDSFEGSIDNITLTDTGGNTFYLGFHPESGISQAEMATVNIGSAAPAFEIGWPLTQISTPYGETLTFSYCNHTAPNQSLSNYVVVTGGNVYTPHPETVTIPDHGNITSGVTCPNPDYGELLLEKVETENETIEIIRKESPSNVIQKILIKDYAGKTIKHIEFSYYETNKNRWHNLLAQITIAQSIYDEEKYKFEYYAPKGNVFGLNIADQWGYYKSVLSAWDLTKPFIHEEFAKENIVTEGTMAKIPCRIGALETASFARNFAEYQADRTGDNLYPQSFSLKKITYPTGGSSEFIYEPNEYRSSALSRDVKAGGQRIRKIILRESEADPGLTTEYKYGENESGLGIANLDISPAFFMGAESNTNTFFISNVEFGHVDTFTKTFYREPTLPEVSHFQVQYNSVAKYRYRETGDISNGKVVSRYLVPEQFHTTYTFEPSNIRSNMFGSLLHSQWASRTVDMYRPGMFPVLYEQTYYDAQSKPLRKSRYEYIMVNDHIFEGIKASQIGNFPDVYLKKKQPDHDRYSAYDAFNRVISCCYPTIHTGTQVLSSQQDISYFGTDSVVVSRTFEYDDRNRLVRETQTDSDNTLIAQEYTYPDATLANGLVLSNMLLNRIRTRTFKGTGQTSSLAYHYSGNTIWPVSVSRSFGEGPQTTLFTLDRYDERGNLLQSSDPNGISTTYLWGYGGTRLVAEIRNAAYQQVANVLGQARIDAMTDRITLSESDIAALEGLRSAAALGDTQITTYTHHPIFGVTSRTDLRGVRTSYLYDETGRIKEIADDAGNPVVAYDYKYRK